MPSVADPKQILFAHPWVRVSVDSVDFEACEKAIFSIPNIGVLDTETFPELETVQITDTDSPRIKTATCQRMLHRMCTSLHQSTVEVSIKVRMNKFCVRPWQPRHKGPFNVNLS